VQENSAFRSDNRENFYDVRKKSLGYGACLSTGEGCEIRKFAVGVHH